MHNIRGLRRLQSEAQATTVKSTPFILVAWVGTDRVHTPPTWRSV